PRTRHILAEFSSTFHGRDIFAPVAAHLSNGIPAAELAEPVSSPLTPLFPEPSVESSRVSGEIIHTDRFGNLISNARLRHLYQAGLSRDVSLTLNDRTITGLYQGYAGVPEGELLLLVSSAGFIEIGCNRCSAAERTGAAAGAKFETKDHRHDC
ncbi:S-adenosyl-l-methionine hydroxide adenosyltransferase family protein, partial [candidate division KSB1 bacterium]